MMGTNDETAVVVVVSSQESAFACDIEVFSDRLLVTTAASLVRRLRTRESSKLSEMCREIDTAGGAAKVEAAAALVEVAAAAPHAGLSARGNSGRWTKLCGNIVVLRAAAGYAAVAAEGAERRGQAGQARAGGHAANLISDEDLYALEDAVDSLATVSRAPRDVLAVEEAVRTVARRWRDEDGADGAPESR